MPAPSRLLAALLAVALLPAAGAQAQLPRAAAQAVIDGELSAAMAAAGPGERLPVRLVMSAQLTGRELAAHTRGAPSPRAARRQLVAALKEYAGQSQAGVRAVLDAAVEDGRAQVRGVLWMGNAVLLEAEPDVLAALAQVPGVDRIRLQRATPVERQQDGGVVEPAGRGGAAPGRPPGAAVRAVAPRPAPAPLAMLPPGVGSYPFADDFESGTLLPHWTVATTGAGQVLVTQDHDPLGQWHLTMDSAVSGVLSTASITVQLDLSGQTDVGIRFRYADAPQLDEDHPGEDALLVSADGITFHPVVDLVGGAPVHQAVWVDLDDVLPGLGLEYGPTFHVRWQWKDNMGFPFDGLAFDQIEIGPGLGVAPPAVTEPHVVALGAPELWERGFDGDGVLVGVIDSGCNLAHPDLAAAVWTNPGEIDGNGLDDDNNGFVDDVRGWDFVGGDPDVATTDGHGTSVAGLIVGDGTLGRGTGVAPGARFVMCRIGREADYWLAQQYLLELGVDVLSSSYSYKWPDRPDYHLHRQLCDVELAAGLVHGNSIGNQGNQLFTHPLPFNVAAPGNAPSPFGHPALAAGGRSSVLAVGGILLADESLYLASGRGPSAWEDLAVYDAAWPHPQQPGYWDYPYGGFGGGLAGLIKPDLVAYTNSVKTTSLSGGYVDFTGTSASTPQVGGALALLKHVRHEAAPRHLAAALELTAADLGPPGKDTQFGSGRPRLFHAARRLEVLGRFDPHELQPGDPFDLRLFARPGAVVFGFFGASLLATPADWNLPPSFFFLGAFVMDGNGEATVPGNVPNDPILEGLTVWFQFGSEPADFTWGHGPWMSVPEPLLIGG